PEAQTPEALGVTSTRSRPTSFAPWKSEKTGAQATGASAPHRRPEKSSRFERVGSMTSPPRPGACTGRTTERFSDEAREGPDAAGIPVRHKGKAHAMRAGDGRHAQTVGGRTAQRTSSEQVMQWTTP